MLDTRNPIRFAAFVKMAAAVSRDRLSIPWVATAKIRLNFLVSARMDSKSPMKFCASSAKRRCGTRSDSEISLRDNAASFSCITLSDPKSMALSAPIAPFARSQSNFRSSIASRKSKLDRVWPITARRRGSNQRGARVRIQPAEAGQLFRRPRPCSSFGGSVSGGGPSR